MVLICKKLVNLIQLELSLVVMLLSNAFSIQYLARQGLACRGHKEGEGNLDQLIKFSAGMNEDLQAWLPRNQDYTSPAIQNEMLALVASHVVRAVCQDIRKQDPAIFSVIVDGTRDSTGTEKKSVYNRYIADSAKSA